MFENGTAVVHAFHGEGVISNRLDEDHVVVEYPDDKGGTYKRTHPADEVHEVIKAEESVSD